MKLLLSCTVLAIENHLYIITIAIFGVKILIILIYSVATHHLSQKNSYTFLQHYYKVYTQFRHFSKYYQMETTWVVFTQTVTIIKLTKLTDYVSIKLLTSSLNTANYSCIIRMCTVSNIRIKIATFS